MSNNQLSKGFLQHTLFPPANFSVYHFFLENGVSITHHGIGVIEVNPAHIGINPSDIGKAIVISSGVHGDETAPIELVDELVSDILKEIYIPKHRILFIIAHPAAIHAHTRFIVENLNRLFAGLNDNKNAECELANYLQNHVTAFYANDSSCSSRPKKEERWHFDLHSAIRESKHYMFAVVPASTRQTDIRPLANFLHVADMDAMLLSITPSSTFSWWTAQNFSALSATFEMGRVAPLYKNNMEELSGLKRALKALLIGDLLRDRRSKCLRVYKVSRTIVKSDQNFTLEFSDQTANFTYFPEGKLLAQENGVVYTAGKEGEAVVFPNANVAIDQRACLLVQSFHPDFTLPLYVRIDQDQDQEQSQIVES